MVKSRCGSGGSRPWPPYYIPLWAEIPTNVDVERERPPLHLCWRSVSAWETVSSGSPRGEPEELRQMACAQGWRSARLCISPAPPLRVDFLLLHHLGLMAKGPGKRTISLTSA